jgi:hypothetical protein
MSEHVTKEQAGRLRDGSLPPARIAEVGRHAATCAPCARLIELSFPVHRMVSDIRIQLEAEDDFSHLSLDDLIAHADGDLHGESLERTLAHLGDCESCRSELENVRTTEVIQKLPRRWLVYSVAASIATVIAVLAVVRRTDAPPPRDTPGVSARPSAQVAPVAVARGYGNPQWNEWVAEAKATRAFPIPDIVTQLKPRRAKLRGESDAQNLHLWPSGVVIEENRPRFRWDARGSSARYTVILEVGDQIVESGPLSATEWVMPRNLKRGLEYAWQVEVAEGTSRVLFPRAPHPPARFRILEQNALDEIDAARRQFPNDRLLEAVLLARHGLRDEAIKALEGNAIRDRDLAAALRSSLDRWPSSTEN